MVYKKSGGVQIGETDTWNVAADYSRLKIMKHLYFLDEYEIIATFGGSDIVEDFTIDERSKIFARIKSLERFAKTLEMLINNSIFAINVKDKDGMKQLLEQTRDIMKLIPMCSTRIINQRDKTSYLSIKEDVFTLLLNSLITIKSEVNDPLNRANLIFREREDISPEQLKKDLMDQMADGV